MTRQPTQPSNHRSPTAASETRDHPVPRPDAASDHHHEPSHDLPPSTHRGDLTDPRDIDHRAMTAGEQGRHAGHGRQDDHGAHGGHGGHADIFRRRFWLNLLLTIPVVLYSEMVQAWLRFSMPSFPGSEWVPPILGTIVFLYGGWVFLAGGWSELTARKPGMMLLISLAILVAFAASAATTLGFFDLEFWWELALLVTIMLLGHWQEMRALGQAQGALNALAALLPDEAERVTGDGVETVALTALRVGDIALVRPGARVPADGEIVEGQAELDESMMTGESRTVSKNPGDPVIAGTVVAGAAIRVRVNAVGEATALAGIQRLVAEAQQSRSRAQALADRFAAALFYIAVATGAATYIIWVLLGQPENAVVRAVTVLVISCPHALGLAIPLVIALSTSLAAQHGMLIKDRLALERMRQVTTVLFDKTGTLTRGEHVVTAIATANSELSDDDLLALAAAVESDSEHPVARAIVRAAHDRQLAIPQAREFRSITGRGVEAIVAGDQVAVGGPTLLRERQLSLPETLTEREAGWE